MADTANDGSNSPPKIAVSPKDQLFSILLGELDTVLERIETLTKEFNNASDSLENLLKQQNDTNKLLVSNIKFLSGNVENYRKTLTDANEVNKLNIQQVVKSERSLARKVTMLSVLNYVLCFIIIAILYLGLHQ